jgi:hypothetical protein
MQVFFAMALHDLDENVQAMEILLRNVAETSSDPEIASYKEAISYYASRLDEIS